MVDALRVFLNRPLSDSDRRRLFALATALIAFAAALLSLVSERSGPSAATPPRPPLASAAPVAAAASPTTSTATSLSTPGEEGAPVTATEPSRMDVAAARRAARRFLADYLPYTYGRRQAERVAAAAPDLRRRLARQRPRVPPGERRRHARVLALQSDGVSRDRAAVSGVIDDGARRYSIDLELAHTSSGWLVTRAGA